MQPRVVTFNLVHPASDLSILVCRYTHSQCYVIGARGFPGGLYWPMRKVGWGLAGFGVRRHTGAAVFGRLGIMCAMHDRSEGFPRRYIPAQAHDGWGPGKFPKFFRRRRRLQKMGLVCLLKIKKTPKTVTSERLASMRPSSQEAYASSGPRSPATPPSPSATHPALGARPAR